MSSSCAVELKEFFGGIATSQLSILKITVSQQIGPLRIPTAVFLTFYSHNFCVGGLTGQSGLTSFQPF